MRVYFKCPNCKFENRLTTQSRTRIEFAMKNGKTRETNCKNCNQNFTLNANKFYAKKSKLISIIAGLIFFAGTSIGLYFVMQMISEMETVIGIFTIACGLLIPVWIYGILNKEDSNRVKVFNQTYVSE